MSNAVNPKLSHLDEAGNARMVDVSEKQPSARKAIAEGEIQLSREAMRLLVEKALPKGDVLTVAKIAGIQAAKRTAELIPLCHSLPLSFVDVKFETDKAASVIRARAEASTTGNTGVEMEALTAVSFALLTVYDMTKSVDKTMNISNIRLLYKSGGKSGEYQAPNLV